MNLIERVKNVLLQPRQTWATIDVEPATPARLLMGYYMILAAIPAVCGFVGLSLIGVGAFGVSIRVPLLTGLVNMVVSYVLSVAAVVVLAFIIDVLAPTFGGRRSQTQALKVAVFASTAALLGGVFTVLPALAVLGLAAALYSIYLLYTGLPVLMNSAESKSAAYTAVVVVAAIVMGVVLAALSAMLLPGSSSPWGRSAAPTVTIGANGATATLDTAGLEAAGKRMEEAVRRIEEAQKSQDPSAVVAATANATATAAGALGAGPVISAQQLKAALPDRLGSFPRTGFELHDGAALGLPTSQASGRYGRDDKEVRLEIADLGGLGSMALMALGMAQGEQEDQTSAEKTWQEAGRTLHQRYEKDGSHAEVKAVLKNGLVVSLEGDRVAVNDLRSLLSHVDLNMLEGLQRKPKP